MTRRPSAPVAILSLVAVAPASAQELPAPAPPAPVVAPPSHPALATGWATVVLAGETVRAAPDPAAGATGIVTSARIAGRARAAVRGADGTVWVRLAFPGAIAGWAPGGVVRAAPAPPALRPDLRRLLTRTVASLGPASALVVRDPLGRTVFAAGSRAPLSIASVTKVATVTAALGTRAVAPGRVAAILRPSDNARAQALSTAVVGDGDRVLGARRTMAAIAVYGASWALVDGSGLSPSNRASAGEVADLLLGVRDAPRFRTLLRGLPVAGRSGTLRDRMRGTAAQGRVRAKTGSLFSSPASTLAGYVWPAGAGPSPDRALVMAMLVNRVSPYRARPVQDAVTAALAAPGALLPPG